MSDNKHYIVRSEYLATALSFLGFRYYRLDWGKETVYSFENTERFQNYKNLLMKMKRENMEVIKKH